MKLDAREAGQADALADRAVHLRQVGRARGRARQRDRRRDRGRPRAPAPSARADRPGRGGVAPPLQPHGHRAADLRPLGDAGPLPQPGGVVRRARRSRRGSTRARAAIDRAAQAGAARHGRDAALRPADPRHGLVARSCPPIEGFGAPGTFVLRTADDALGLRAFAQRHGAQRAVVAGGGLLGLEAAYALHKLGLRTTVLERGDRLLRRQLDARASGAPAGLPRGARAGDR